MQHLLSLSLSQKPQGNSQAIVPRLSHISGHLKTQSVTFFLLFFLLPESQRHEPALASHTQSSYLAPPSDWCTIPLHNISAPRTDTQWTAQIQQGGEKHGNKRHETWWGEFVVGKKKKKRRLGLV